MAQAGLEMIIGLQFGSDFAQVTWCSRGMKEPVTAGSDGAAGQEQYEVPPQVWESACGREDRSVLSAFLDSCIRDCVTDPQYEQMRIMITLPELEKAFWESIPGALTDLGCERKWIYLQDYQSGFYYYTVNKKKELWSGDVALLEFKDGTMIGSVLHIDRTKTPALVTVEEAARGKVDESMRAGRDDEAWDKERDRLFFELLKKVFERRNVVTCYLMGDYYDRSWAPRSFQYLCFRRHAFQGKNLFSKGACYACMERAGMLRMPDLLYLGKDVISQNLNMVLRVRGRETVYPLISAGINWYEAQHECDIIPDGETNITIQSKPMRGGAMTEHVLRLVHFPDRPNRATRLHLSVYFTSPVCCEVEAEDLGFGGLYRASGKRWKRKIYLE